MASIKALKARDEPYMIDILYPHNFVWDQKKGLYSSFAEIVAVTLEIAHLNPFSSYIFQIYKRLVGQTASQFEEVASLLEESFPQLYYLSNIYFNLSGTLHFDNWGAGRSIIDTITNEVNQGNIGSSFYVLVSVQIVAKIQQQIQVAKVYSSKRPLRVVHV